MKLISWIVLWVTIIFMVGRLFITPRLQLPTSTGSYEALAHLWVGGLFGAAIAYWLSSREVSYRPEYLPSICGSFKLNSKFCWILGLIFSTMELATFTIQKIWE